MKNITLEILKSLSIPSENSHKGENGKILIIGGSKRFHGSPIFAAKIASKIVDLVYFCSTPENNSLVREMKKELPDFITVERDEVINWISKVDAVLVGPGMEVTEETRILVNTLLKQFPKQKFILDADALRVVDKSLLNKSCVVTPHTKEFEALFGVSPSPKKVLEMAKKYNCVVVLKGQKDYVSDGFKLKVNETGNQGMTKGGMGDVLAGLITALAAKNNLFLAASAGVFINGLAGDSLKEKVSCYYNTSDLISEIPYVLKKLLC